MGSAAASQAGCGGDKESPTSSSTSTGSGGGGGAGGASSGFGSSACGTCAVDACKTYVDACKSDPQCPAYLDCLLACPPAKDGPNVDPACAAQCDTGTSSESKRAAADVLACITVGDGATQCAPCGSQIVVTANRMPETCPASTEPDACNKCEAEQCCNELDPCTSSPSACADYVDCYTTCAQGGGTEGACLSQCAASNASGEAQFASLFACNQYWCESCKSIDACAQCGHATCKGQTNALMSDPQGFLLYFCFSDCLQAGGTVTGCENTCFADHMQQRDLFDAYEECVLVGCKDACSQGQ
ncbi:MAG TPA: hypothetical protein VHB21_24715 [Minicystis sp.]|nr:hypothetical protein [Minicystis sp.]